MYMKKIIQIGDHLVSVDDVVYAKIDKGFSTVEITFVKDGLWKEVRIGASHLQGSEEFLKEVDQLLHTHCEEETSKLKSNKDE